MAEPSPRWATFDCYGTLVDWNRGIGTELGRLFGESRARIQREQPTSSYRDVMALALAELASEAGAELTGEERGALGRSLPDWPVFPEVPDALAEAKRRGWRLVALSNTDRASTLTRSLKEPGVSMAAFTIARYC